MGEHEPWFVQERAEALAIIYLTRHQGVEVAPAPRHSRFDLLVYLGQPESSESARLAIEVKGIVRRRNGAHQAGERRFSVRYAADVLGPTDIPVCTFLFDVDDEQGYYRWLHEPIISARGAELAPDPLLWQALPDARGQITVTGEFAGLTDEAVAALLGRVEDWHVRRRERVLLSQAI